MNLWHLLERAATRWPDRTAAAVGDRSWTWRALHDVTSRLAGTLTDAGIAPGDRVAILARNGVEYLSAYFAVAASGAVLVPLNVRWTGREIHDVFVDCDPALLLAGTRFHDVAPSLGGRGGGTAIPVVRLDDAFAAAQDDDRSGVERLAPPSGDGLAQLYYTSGTTGKPKGVMLSHQNVVAHALSAIAELQLGEGDVWAHIAPMFHLADAWSTFAITAVGGCHVFLSEFDPAAAVALLRTRCVTITNVVPTMLRLMLEHAGDGGGGRDLRVLMSGGAPIAPDVVQQVIEAFDCEYVQTYGMTETSPFLTMSLLTERERAGSATERLARAARTGRAVLGIELRVVDEAGSTVPSDDRTVGEIQVRGLHVTAGYWNDPVATAEAFTPDGFLKTGDLATIDELGSVRIVDRKKDVILTGGENVYSTEVEHRLNEHPAVLEAAVFGTRDPTWGERVTAAVVLRPGAVATAAELTGFCRESLASFKVPKTVRFCDALPRTGSGKIHKAALRGDPRIG